MAVVEEIRQASERFYAALNRKLNGEPPVALRARRTELAA